MSDVVVTVPKWFWTEWIAEGDAAGEPNTGQLWDFSIGGRLPSIEKGERVYIVAHDKLRGFAPLVRVEEIDYHLFALVRNGGAVAVTIDEPIKGFRGFRYRWWQREDEKPFPNWKEIS